MPFQPKTQQHETSEEFLEPLQLHRITDLPNYFELHEESFNKMLAYSLCFGV